ncbi:MAG TPA: hypothetical protein VFS21_29695 [Roseiflexaceae bacterium]|nr:hypothetical protein [Roseiflexaceae bacterium]
MIDATQREGQPDLISLAAGPALAREEELLQLLRIIAELRGQGAAADTLERDHHHDPAGAARRGLRCERSEQNHHN